MAATYNPDLVLVSAIIAVVASYTALDLAGRVTTALVIEGNLCCTHIKIAISRMDSL